MLKRCDLRLTRFGYVKEETTKVQQVGRAQKSVNFERGKDADFRSQGIVQPLDLEINKHIGNEKQILTWGDEGDVSIVSGCL